MADAEWRVFIYSRRIKIIKARPSRRRPNGLRRFFFVSLVAFFVLFFSVVVVAGFHSMSMIWALPSFTGFPIDSLLMPRFSFTLRHSCRRGLGVEGGLVRFERVLLGFTGFYWVLLGFTGFLASLTGIRRENRY